MMYKDMLESLQRPELYKPSGVNFWNDEHISMQMLNAHLDPDFEGASRKRDFIEQSVQWITEIAPPSGHPGLLDIGCGPGLYTERFSTAGFHVTGIDFSRRSIDYAASSARKQGLDIAYIYQDYLTIEYESAFDLATLIYCDYGALSAVNRAVLLRKIYRSLRSGGKLVMDVFSMPQYDAFQESKTWHVHETGGFWSPDKHLSLHEQYKYNDHVTLEHTAVITGNTMTEYCLWNRYYTPDTLAQEAAEAGFRKMEMFGDVAGKPYTKDSPTIGILLEK